MRAKNVQQYLLYIIMLFSSFWIFFCFNESSMAVEAVALALLFLILSPRSDTFRDVVFIFILTAFFAIALALSGRFFERGDYNIPWKFLVKFMHISFAAICGSVIKNFPDKQKRNIVISALVSIGISSIVSLYYVLRVNSLAIRYRQLIGITQTFSFDQLFALPILVPILVMFFLKYRKTLRHKWLFLAVTILSLICVLYSVLTTAILIMLMGLALLILFNAFESGKKSSIIWAGILVLVLFIFLIFRTQIGELLYGFTSGMSDVVRGRLQRVIDMLFATEHANAYSMDRRFELANYSLDTFKAHPLFGVGIWGIQYGVIGYHQDWPDVLGVCGLFGTAIIAVILYDYIRRLLRRTEKKIDKVGTIIGLILMFVLGCLDPCLVLPELFVVFVILPNLSTIVDVGDQQ